MGWKTGCHFIKRSRGPIRATSAGPTPRLDRGEFPVSGTSVDDIKGAHAAGKRTYLHDARPELTAGFVRAIERALVREPTQRYGSAGEMEAALAHSLGFQLFPAG